LNFISRIKISSHIRLLQTATFVFLFVPVFRPHLAAAQNVSLQNNTVLQHALTDDGFENVIAQGRKNILLVEFEDSRYRYSAAGIIRVYGHTITSLPSAASKVFFTVLKYDVPLFCLESTHFQTLSSSTEKQTVRLPQLSFSRREEQVLKLMSHFPKKNPSRFRTDVIIHPDLHLNLGDYDNPVAAQINLVPELRSTIAKGIFVSASLILPLYNELESWGNYVRLGPTLINGIIRLGQGAFAYGSAGFFKDQRYGAQAGLKKYIFSSAVMLDGRIGLSGYGMMDKGRFKYSDLDALSASVSATCFQPRLQLFFTLGVHRFVYKDYGLHLQIFRFFHDFRFGFWSVYTNAEFNGGFQFALPLPPKRYRPRRFFRIHPADYFNWSYQAKRNTLNGTRLRANEIIDDLFVRYNPNYIKSKMSVFE